jgi:hypothetical protein
MRYTFDNCLSSQLVSALREFGEDVAHRGHATDTTWIPSAVQKDIVIISVDLAPKNLPGKTKLEARAFHEAGAIVFYLPSEFSRWKQWEQIACFFKYWPAIKTKAEKARPGNVFEVAENGRVQRKTLR